MTYEIINNAVKINAENGELNNAAGILEQLINIKYETDIIFFIIPKEALPEAFFDLKTGFAGEVLQKLVNYGLKAAIIGDFSVYQSKSLKDFIYESNKGKHVKFLASIDEVAKVSTDPFYTPANMKALEKSIKQAKDGKLISKTIEELQDME